MTTTEVVRKHQPAPRGESLNSLNQVSWASFLDAHITKDESGAWILNRRRLTESHSRSYYRWKHEGNKTTIFGADVFLTNYWVHIDSYFFWCQAKGLDPWEFGEPAWHREDISA